MNMLDINDEPGQARPQFQGQNTLSNHFAGQNQPAQAQYPVTNAANNNNNNVPAMDYGISEEAIDPQLMALEQQLQLALASAASQTAPQQRTPNPPTGPVEGNTPVGQDSRPPFQAFVSTPPASPKPFSAAGHTNPAESSAGPRRSSRLKSASQEHAIPKDPQPKKSPAKKRKARSSSSPPAQNRSQSLAQPQAEAQGPNNHNGGNNPAVRDKRSATVGSSMNPPATARSYMNPPAVAGPSTNRPATAGSGMNPPGPQNQFPGPGHSSEPGSRLPPNNLSSGSHRDQRSLDAIDAFTALFGGNRAGSNLADAAQIVSQLADRPAPSQPTATPASRRERLYNALQAYHKDCLTAWSWMPNGVRRGFLKELLLAESRGECLTQWEHDLLWKSKEEHNEIVYVYREITMDTNRELQSLQEKHRRLEQALRAAGQRIEVLKQYVDAVNKERAQVLKRVTFLERSHLGLSQVLEERVHILNGKVDRKVQELEEAIAKLKVGEGRSQDDH